MKYLGNTLSLLAAIASFTTAASAQIAFGPAQSFATAAQRPDSVAGGDFDGVNGTDLAITTGSPQGTNGPDWVEIYLNQGGSFTRSQQIFMGNNVATAALVSGDFDADGDLDLAVSMKNSNTVGVLFNTGGTFAAGVPIQTGGLSPEHMVAGDVDADGDLDLVTSNRDSSSLSVLLNNGAGGFSASTQIAVGADPRYIALAHLNADCTLDLAVAAHDSRRVDVLLGNGSGGFGGLTSYLVPNNNKPTGMAAADLDGDGDQDLVTSTDENGVGQLCVLTNQGGSFSSFCFTIGGSNPGAVAIGDFDADGDKDLAAADEDANSVRAVPNLGGGVFGAAVLAAVGAHPSDLFAGDLDGNGSLDLVTPNRDSNSVSVLMNLGVGGAETFCRGLANSVGSGARLDTSGSLSVAQNAFVLRASCCPAGQNGLFFYGASANDIPFGNGRLCVTGPIFRLNPPSAADGSGRFVRGVDFDSPPASSGAGQIQAGSTFYFQLWYRDPAAGGSAFNTSDALRATFRP